MEGEIIMSRDEVKTYVGWRESKLCERMRLDGFPRPIRRGHNTFWYRSSVDAYLQREKNRNEKARHK